MPSPSRGVTEKDVWKAADALLLEGRRPTVEGVRQQIGRGSPNTVTPYLDTWFRGLGRRLQDPGAFSSPSAVPEPIATAASHFWEVALAAARGQVETELAHQREELDRERQALRDAQLELLAEKAALEVTKSAMDETVSLAKAQLGEANRQIQTLEERLATHEGRNRDLADDLRDLRNTLEAERAAVTQERILAAQERAGEVERHQAAERRWLTEVDAARALLRTTKEEIELGAAAFAAERKDWERQRAELLDRERNVAAELAQARAAALAASTQARASQDQLAQARADIAAHEARVHATREEFAKQLEQAQAQLDEALRAMGRTWNTTRPSEPPKALA